MNFTHGDGEDEKMAEKFGLNGSVCERFRTLKKTVPEHLQKKKLTVL